MKTLKDYHELYLKTDVLLLEDVFENFRITCKKHYNSDPAHYYTSPGLSWDTMLKTTNVSLELLTDVNMLLMVERGIRGGVSTITKRYAKANNPYMGDEYDPDSGTTYLAYRDANNLYGWAMSQKLPVNGFKWMSKSDILDWEKTPCILEVDLDYPQALHDSHNEYPLAPERLKINDVEKLIPNLHNKTKYVLHHESLRFYLQKGLMLKKIHRGIGFCESNWIASYINLNTYLRKQATNDFEKNFFKFINNSALQEKARIPISIPRNMGRNIIDIR